MSEIRSKNYSYDGSTLHTDSRSQDFHCAVDSTVTSDGDDI